MQFNKLLCNFFKWPNNSSQLLRFKLWQPRQSSKSSSLKTMKVKMATKRSSENEPIFESF